MDLGILLGHTCISGMPLELPGKLSCCRPCLAHCGHAQTQVELITLQPVMDMFNYLPLGDIAVICPSNPINLHHPQCTTSVQPRITIWAHFQMSHGTDGHWSQIFGHGMGVGQHPVLDRQKPSLERGISGLLLQMGQHLSRTSYHHSLNGRAQFPPTIQQPKGLAAGRWKSTTKSGSASKWHGIWTHYLIANGGMVCNGAPGRRS